MRNTKKLNRGMNGKVHTIDELREIVLPLASRRDTPLVSVF